MIQALFGWVRHFVQPPESARIQVSRRAMLAASAAGVGGGLLFRIHPQAAGRSYHPDLIRPPGSLGEDDFLARCLRCGECMKVCPTNGLHPAWLEGGLVGLWSPVFKMKLGYCEYECTLCLQVCPTQAIQKLSVEEKQKVKVGLAFIDKNRCLPFALARTCIVCEEHCPTPKKAIWFEEVTVTSNELGEKTIVKQPHINPDLCLGCGICENKCPVEDQPAIYVTSVGESRNLKNQVLLTSSFQ